ncbi:MAG: hypothetical protein KF773_11195 [Deltaproteobacteria bacterium]|nr:hypothetical protein [Deltaproteobacteria bacterium]MCW5803139.1 hypothetical protein [Deltaproteobacteria bacterium]
MTYSKLLGLGLAAALAAPTLASAETRTQIAEVSADPRDGADRVDLELGRRTTAIELRARAAPVRLHSVRILTADGRSRVQRVERWLAPGESLTLDLPRSVPLDALVLDYGDPATRPTDRTPARLELYAVSDQRREVGWQRRFRDDGAAFGMWERDARRVQRMPW